MTAGTQGVESAADRRPNLLVVVMDCVRGEDFRPGTPPLTSMPFASALARQSVVFPKAVAPASWTIPSHASVFTGLYPWEHRLHARGEAQLDPRLPRLPQELGALGYRTLSLSANPFICDRMGLTEGFESAAWGGWWERHVRHLPEPNPPGGRGLATGEPEGFSRVRGGGAWPVALGLSRQLLRYPWFLNLLNSVIYGVRRPAGECPACVAPWIERTLDSWLGSIAPEEPSFVFVNLMEAHEPYLTDRSLGPLGDRLRAQWTRQDFTHWLEGEWAPSAREAETLEALYVAAIRSIDHRLRAIVETFERASRWENTAMILTSDHGQGTGQNGWLSHGMSVDESHVRIPLWVRLPGNAFGGRECTEWASLVDIRPTFLELAGTERESPGSGTPLTGLLAAPRAGPVWALSEGVLYEASRRRMSPRQLQRFDRVLLAGFQGDVRTVYDCDGNVGLAYLAERRPGIAPRPLPATMPPAAGMLSYSARLAGSVADRELSPPNSIASRIESWGYC